MKRFKIMAYILVAVVVFVLSFFIYTSIAKEAVPDIKDKTLSEIQYFESKIVYMFNSLNNIEFENYKISIDDISEKSKKSSENSSGAGSTNDASSEGGSTSGGGSSIGEASTSSESNQTSLDETKKYTLSMKGVLSSTDQINWSYIKNEAEMLENSISTLTLDLYEIGLNNTDILNFSKDYDILLVYIKNEDKESTLKQLSLLYSYMPKFVKNCNTEQTYDIVINTKFDIFKAYSILDSEDWNAVNGYLQNANESFSKLLTDINIKNKNQYTVNKCYVSLNGLINSVEQKDKEIFLIKYRNLLEDLNNI